MQVNTNGVRPLSENAPVDVNLCAGAGGLAVGVAQTGFGPFDFFDRDRGACETLRHNIGKDCSSLKGRVVEGDLTHMEWLRTSPPVRLLMAGPPCQPFSAGGTRRGHEDERNLFPSMLEAVRVLRPRAILIENVRGLTRPSHSAYLEYILRQLAYPDVLQMQDEAWQDHDERIMKHCSGKQVQPAYEVRSSVFNAADFGVPQIRHRLFIVATAADLPPYDFPKPTHSKQALLRDQHTGVYWENRELVRPVQSKIHLRLDDSSTERLPWVTVRDGISNLPPASLEENDRCNNHWIIQGARAYSGHTGSTLDWPSKTLKAGVHGVAGGENMMVMDDGSLRYFTLREMARLQSFPDSCYFVGARSNVIRQIGNATPCNLAAAVSAPLYGLLEPQLVGEKVDSVVDPYTAVHQASGV